MNEPSKEAMEKAKEKLAWSKSKWITTYDIGEFMFADTILSRSQKEFVKQVNGLLEIAQSDIAIEFTNYQKRIEELEKVVALCLETLTDGEQSEPHAYLPAINACRSAIKSHLAKGVKEEG
jgi:hypothetical protein